MNQKVKWGVLGVAKIATHKVIPGMQNGEWCEIAAIASRDWKKAVAAANELGILEAGTGEVSLRIAQEGPS